MASQQMNKAAKKFQKSYFDVLGLCCSSEVPLIENILKPLEGIKEVSVIVPSRTVIVVHDSLLISQIQIVKALNQARLEANIRVYGENKHQKKWPSPYAMASGLLLLLSFLKYVYSPLQWLALGAVAAGILPIVLKAITSIRNYRLDINILMIVAVVGTVAMNDYLEAGTIVFLFTIAEWLESRASHKASDVMSSLMNIAPQKAVIAESGEVVDADEVKVSTILAVKAGEVIPIDGIVADGNCEVDEKTLTGESFPVPKQKDSIVWAGTINLNGYVSVKTTALAEDCVVAKMAKLVEEAQNSKTKTQRFIDRCAKFYTPAVLVSSALLAVVPAALRVHNRNLWFHLALVVLVSACPCALILSTPVATFCALTKAASFGLLIKGGDCLETFAKVKVAAFDKTGTLTRGEFVVTDIQSLHGDIDLNSLIFWVSSIESKSSHPMAAAIVDYGRSFSIEPKPEEVEEFQNFPGEGIYGKIDGKDIYIGNRKIGVRAGSETVPALQGDTKEGRTIGYVYLGTTPIGIFALSDACRSGVVEAIRELKLLGIKTAMLTGDSQAAAMHVQDQLGGSLELIHAELLPEDKVKIITEFKKEGPTAMIGDGLNDAPALATANIGISMGISGSALATETGNMILMSNDIRKIPKAIRLARKAHRKVIENVILSISTKAVILGLAFAGHPLVWAAVLADVGTCLTVIFNSMLLLHRRHRHGDNTQNESQSQKSCSANTQTASQAQKCASQKCVSKCHSTPNTSRLGVKTTCTNSTESHDKCKGSFVSHDDNNCHQGISDKGKHKFESHDMEDQCCSGPQTLSSGTEDGFHEANHCHHQEGCDKKKHRFQSLHVDNHDQSGSHNFSLIPEDQCENSHLKQSTCVEDTEFRKHCHSGCCSIVTHDTASHSSPFSSRHSTSEKSQQYGSDHCLLIHVYENHKDEVLGKTLDSSHQKQNSEAHPDFKKHATDHTSIDIVLETVKSASEHPHTSLENKEQGSCCKGSSKEFVESPVMHACASLDKRGIGGCCKSYMKECCGQQGHLGPGFGGGLSEMITE
ncbi:Cadmium/zinc-transporting ATPase 3 [Quillaja saponaria]|uniref:Cadmium/zinc-transporting ATPase 3 n=1 Tax=Quillaja saponaria TaxID=32244 RepID=A0AAD7LCY2_QUISA|nr:Cadmium/zinc-transporting ATPase 3 [Quillaja saponaria]